MKEIFLSAKDIIKRLPKLSAIRTETIEEAEQLFEILISLDYRWFNGKEYDITKTNWSGYRENTCYEFPCGHYSSLDYFQSRGYKIITFKELMRQSMSIVSDDKLVGCLYTHNERPYEEIVMHLAPLMLYPTGSDYFNGAVIRSPNLETLGYVRTCNYADYFKIEDMSLSLKINENV